MSTSQPTEDTASNDQSNAAFQNLVGPSFFEPSAFTTLQPAAFATPVRTPRHFLEESMFTTPDLPSGIRAEGAEGPDEYARHYETPSRPSQIRRGTTVHRRGSYEDARRDQRAANVVTEVTEPAEEEAEDRVRRHEQVEAEGRSGRDRNINTPKGTSPRRVTGRTSEEKLALVLDALNGVGWSIGDFMYHVFRIHDKRGHAIRCDPSLGTKIGRFLSGRNKHTAIEIISYWLEDERGRPKRTDAEHALRYSPDVEWHTIKHAGVAITAMAVQLCEKRIRREQKAAVKGSSGLHGSAVGKRGHRELRWEDIGKNTVAEAQKILRKFQPLSLHLIQSLATPAPRKSDGSTSLPRTTRPPALVATEILSSLNFSRTHYARLLPAVRGILFFAGMVPRIVFDYCSRVGVTPSWSTVYLILAKLARQEAAKVIELGRDENVWLVLRGDNVQHQRKQRERRLGRENAMKVGFAGTAAEVEGFDPAAASLDDHLHRVAEKPRTTLTVDRLGKLIDAHGIELALELQWLQVLVTYVPSLKHYKQDVAKLFRTDAAQLLLPSNQKTRIHALAPSAKNEAITTDMRDITVDLMEQIGQQRDNYTRRLIPMGGDGLTFEKLVDLKIKMQFHPNEYERLDLVYPFLETWHTQWTFLSLVFETHWGDALTPDPSKLGHSATKINQKGPTNLKKVDYYPASYTAYIVLDGRMLDCWRIQLQCSGDIFAHFEDLASQNKVPSLEELRIHARATHDRYSSQRAYDRAMEGGEAASMGGWTVGSTWVAPNEGVETLRNIGRPTGHEAAEALPDDVAATDSEDRETGDSSVQPPDKSPSSPSANDARSDDGGSDGPAEEEPTEEEPKEPFIGDRTLAQSVLFMRDAMLSREAAQSVAQGDPGRLWNVIKMMVFFFAGSGHTKYTTYTLEMICILELESNAALRDVFLRNWLVNPSGEPGRTIEGDLLQEHINLILEEAIEKKGAEWDSRFIREVLAPCVLHFMELKNEWGIGVGLAKRRGKHPEPHSRPEIRTLLDTYRELELHLFRPGRSYPSSSETANTFREGVIALEKTKLQKFVNDSTRVHVTYAGARSTPSDDVSADASHEEDDQDGADEDDADERQTQGWVRMVDGELLVTFGPSDDDQDIMQASDIIALAQQEEEEEEAEEEEEILGEEDGDRSDEDA